MIDAQQYVIENGFGEGIDSGYKRIEFHLAVTSQDESKNGAGGRIAVVNIFSVKVETSTATTNYSRIKFSTLVALNNGKIT